MEYSHTQRASLYLLLHAVGVTVAVSAWATRGVWPIFVMMWIAAGAMISLGFSFAHLTVCDEGEWLAIRFGPLPIFRRSIPYKSITGVSRGRTSFIDGWGIHWIPGRGWTFNLWGYDCAVLTVGKQTIRIGSDDADNLVAFLRRRIGLNDGSRR